MNIKEIAKALVFTQEGHILLETNTNGEWDLPSTTIEETKKTSRDIEEKARDVAREKCGVSISKTIEPGDLYNQFNPTDNSIEKIRIVPMIAFNNEISDNANWVYPRDIDVVSNKITVEKIQEEHKKLKELGYFYQNANSQWTDYKIAEGN